MNVEIGRIDFMFYCRNNEAEQFHFWEYINQNQTFILDSHRPFIYSAYNDAWKFSKDYKEKMFFFKQIQTIESKFIAPFGYFCRKFIVFLLKRKQSKMLNIQYWIYSIVGESFNNAKRLLCLFL